MSSTSSFSDEASSSPSPVSKKRKRDVQQSQDEIEIDVSAPEPPSKKAMRKARKKGAIVTVKDVSQVDNRKPAKQEQWAHDDDTNGDSKAPKGSEYGIWIGNLPFTATKDDLLKFVTSKSSIGEEQITRIKMPISKDSNKNNAPEPVLSQRRKSRNKGFAYIDFSTEMAKNEAIAMSEKLFTGRAVLIKDALNFEGRPEPIEQDSGEKSQPSKLSAKRVFVGNLSFNATIAELTSHFSKCGPVEQVFLATFEDSGKCKGYGWVTFETNEGATAAVRGWVEWKADSDDEADESTEEQEHDQAVKKKKKPRRWWVNRILGRQLRVEFAEDPTTRYNKRYGKEAKNSERLAKGTVLKEASKEKLPSMSKEPRVQNTVARSYKEDAARKWDFEKLKSNNRAPDRVLEKMKGNIVVAEGKKITFD